MEQMNVDEAHRINVDFYKPDQPACIRYREPLVYKETNAFCCGLVPDRVEGIFGCSERPELALQYCDRNLKQKIATSDADGQVAENVKVAIKLDNTALW